MKNILLLLVSFLLIRTQAQSVVTFEGQAFGTETWTENGINWTLGGWANIRSYNANNGSNHAMFLTGNYLEANHNLNVNSLYIFIDDFDDANSYVDFKGYNSSGSLVKTQRYNTPAFMFGYVQILLSEFSNITKLVLEFDDISGFGSVSVYVDDVNYTDLGALPVELNSFTASLSGNAVNLNWQTATEVGNYGFQVERQYQVSSIEYQDSSNWETIGFVQGHGTTNSPKNYEFTDSGLPDADEVSYRLKQIDNDGTFAYSKIVTVDLTNITSVDDEVVYEFSLEQNYPNPFNPSTTIKFSLPNVETGHASSLQTKLVVYDILGRKVTTLVNQNLQPGNHEVVFDASSLSSGLYFYKINVGREFNSIKKMLLIK